ncbi:MAG: hypothetical protein ACYC6M_13010 [Terriglobales bacterium]
MGTGIGSTPWTDAASVVASLRPVTFAEEADLQALTDPTARLQGWCDLLADRLRPLGLLRNAPVKIEIREMALPTMAADAAARTIRCTTRFNDARALPRDRAVLLLTSLLYLDQPACPSRNRALPSATSAFLGLAVALRLDRQSAPGDPSSPYLKPRPRFARLTAFGLPLVHQFAVVRGGEKRDFASWLLAVHRNEGDERRRLETLARDLPSATKRLIRGASGPNDFLAPFECGSSHPFCAHTPAAHLLRALSSTASATDLSDVSTLGPDLATLARDYVGDRGVRSPLNGVVRDVQTLFPPA